MDEGDILLRRVKRWQAAKWACFGVLAVSVVVALTAAVGRLQRTTELIDSGATDPSSYNRQSKGATIRTVGGLGAGCAALGAYMVCFVMHQRTRDKLKRWRQDERRARLAELGAEEGDL